MHALRASPLDDQRQVRRERRKAAAACRLHAAAACGSGAVVVKHLGCGPPAVLRGCQRGALDRLAAHSPSGGGAGSVQTARLPGAAGQGTPERMPQFAAQHTLILTWTARHQTAPPAEQAPPVCGQARGLVSACTIAIVPWSAVCAVCGQATPNQATTRTGAPPRLTSAPPSLAVTTLLPAPAPPLLSAPSSGAAPMYAAADESFSFCRLDWSGGR